MKNNTINNMIIFWQSKKINGYDCHDCHALADVGPFTRGGGNFSWGGEKFVFPSIVLYYNWQTQHF